MDGVPLSALLKMAGMRSATRYIVFYCADTLETGADHYYESIDLVDAFHPQTILSADVRRVFGPPRPITYVLYLRSTRA